MGERRVVSIHELPRRRVLGNRVAQRESRLRLVEVLPLRARTQGVIDHGLVQHLTTLVQGALDDTPGLVHDPLHRLPGLVDRLLEQAPGLVCHSSYGLSGCAADLSYGSI